MLRALLADAQPKRARHKAKGISQERYLYSPHGSLYLKPASHPLLCQLPDVGSLHHQSLNSTPTLAAPCQQNKCSLLAMGFEPMPPLRCSTQYLPLSHKAFCIIFYPQLIIRSKGQSPGSLKKNRINCKSQGLNPGSHTTLMTPQPLDYKLPCVIYLTQ